MWKIIVVVAISSITVGACITLYFLLASCDEFSTERHSTKQPHIVVIMADDMVRRFNILSIGL